MAAEMIVFRYRETETRIGIGINGYLGEREAELEKARLPISLRNV